MVQGTHGHATYQPDDKAIRDYAKLPKTGIPASTNDTVLPETLRSPKHLRRR
ncbi:hypothetical protein [Bifidobacterium callimiconis]|uniref:Uncharacterized protein n=1 Tax=Bifidobacterium callimiconis TaxID=2306973 RepID=A0A430FI12_9BIFI|nr:hypothetical protein [Bifidobacterium callimiconis]RSX52421.1 hypothetical protein D2E23_0149 [Bifidobacterium callimiconis]